MLQGGKDNFAADRQQAEKLLAVFPRAAELAQESRGFQCRAVTYAVGEGVRQFLDIGCGLPTTPNTHETAQAVHPDATVIYVDNDEQVMTHAENVLATAPNVLAIAGDVTYPDEILFDARIRQVLNYRQPVCVVLTMTLHFFDADTVRLITGRLISGIAPGSYLIVSAGHLEGDTGTQFTRQYAAGHLHHYTRDDLAGFLTGLELAEPGITEARAWRAPVPARPARPMSGPPWAANQP